MLTRLEAIQDINLGRGIQLRFVGHEHADGRRSTFNVILRRNGRGGCEAVIDCRIMRRCYIVQLTAKQVLSYIRLHYPRVDANETDIITLNPNPVACLVAA